MGDAGRQNECGRGDQKAKGLMHVVQISDGARLYLIDVKPSERLARVRMGRSGLLPRG
jgi:hypothetical protein